MTSEKIVWISIDPIFGEVIPYAPVNAIAIEKQYQYFNSCNYGEKRNRYYNSIYLGNNCFNATINFTQDDIFQTTPPICSTTLNRGKPPGKRSVGRFIVPEDNIIIIKLKEMIDGFDSSSIWRLSTSLNFTKEIRYFVSEEVIIYSNNLVSPNVDIWNSTDLEQDSLKTDFNRVVWEWCQHNSNSQEKLFNLPDKDWLPYCYKDNLDIETAYALGDKEIIITPTDNIPRKISLDSSSSFGKQMRFQDGELIGLRLIRRKVVTINQLQEKFKAIIDGQNTLEFINMGIKYLQEHNDTIPIEFCCPITQSIFIDPVKTCDNHTYEESAIKKWFSYGHKTSPMTNLPLANKNLVINYQLKNKIKKFLEDQISLKKNDGIDKK